MGRAGMPTRGADQRVAWQLTNLLNPEGFETG